MSRGVDAMTSNFALWDTITEQVLRYPRADDEPVVALDPRCQVLRIVKEDKPELPEGWSIRQQWSVDLVAGEWRHGWELIELPLPAPPQPDYFGFYSALLGSATYSAVIGMPATAELARALAVFVSAIQDAMNYRVNPQAMQGAIWLLLGQMALTDEHVTELTELMATYHLDLTYTLAPA
jgi:hypothetical protein